MTREQAVKWCQERGYCFVELDDGEIEKGNLRRARSEERRVGKEC